MQDFGFPPTPFVFFDPISIQLFYIHLTKPKWHFPIFWISKWKLLTGFNKSFVAIPSSVFLTTFSFSLLHAHSRVCYCKVAHWDEGWAVGRGWGSAEKGLKYQVGGCLVVFKHPQRSYKELANTLCSFPRKGGLSCGSVRSKRGFYGGQVMGLYSAVRGSAAPPPAGNVLVRTRWRRRSCTECFHPPVLLPPIHSLASL